MERLRRATPAVKQTGWFSKLALFTCTYFRRFEMLMYLDVDGLVAHPVAPLFEALAAQPASTWLLLRDNGPGVFKRTLSEQEFRRGAPSMSSAPVARNPGSTALMVLRNANLPPSNVLLQRVLSAMRRYGHDVLFADQTITLIVFHGHYSVPGAEE